MIISDFFTTAATHPYDSVPWTKRDAVIKDVDGNTIFEKNGVSFPAAWSQNAVNIVTSKYFQPHETSLESLISRVVSNLTRWGAEQDYFETAQEMSTFNDELTYILLHQMASFNSPVWFNVGVYDKPQASACFILSVEDSLEGILDHAKTEGTIFGFGSGCGTNFSTLRSSVESITGGGKASGPLSFMKGYDSFAGAIKSGGKTRRSAKMCILNIDHPDVEQFIYSKMNEEYKAQSLIAAGYSGDLNGEAYETVQYQNANHSVSVTDKFLTKVKNHDEFDISLVKGGFYKRYSDAANLMKKIAHAAWECGDPGLFFHDTVNSWHTCPNDGPIVGSNPCSEYVFLNETACNLASINLERFLCDLTGEFDTQAFAHTVRVLITAQDILVGNATYPTETIAKNSHKYRTLGLGYANLGSVLMRMGLPYDSSEGRAVAAGITALMTGEAYATSAELAKRLGAFERFLANAVPMYQVIKRHEDKLIEDIVDNDYIPDNIENEAVKAWQHAQWTGSVHGYRNAQVTVLAPTGTIALMMDCDTTGIEPELALIKHKKLDGGGTMSLVNQSVRVALHSLGYGTGDVDKIEQHIQATGSIRGSILNPGHLSIFECALGDNAIEPMGHISMMASVQPFLSGAISKTVNIPNDSSIEDVNNLYMTAWESGLKSIAIYRDGSKKTQPLNQGKEQKEISVQETGKTQVAIRNRLPQTRDSITHHFKIGTTDGYIIVGKYEDGSPGEIFVKVAKEGSTLSGLIDAFATAVSMALQYGVPLDSIVSKFSYMRFEPMGFTDNPEIPQVSSIVDYIFRWMGLTFCGQNNTKPIIEEDKSYELTDSSPICTVCGMTMVTNGSCYKCVNCGVTSGCS